MIIKLSIQNFQGVERVWGLDSFHFHESLEQTLRATIALMSVAEFNVHRCMRDPEAIPDIPPWLSPTEPK